MKISICIPTYNRFELTVASFEKVIDDERIAQILIIDDFSNDGSYEKLRFHFKDNQKVIVVRNKWNVGCLKNKFTSILYSTYQWCILLDSDNSIDKDYIDKIYSFEWDEKTFYQPSFAKPKFDYRHLINIYTKENAKEFLDDELFITMLNTQNFFVNRKKYVSILNKNEKEVSAADSIYFAYLWLKNGNKIELVDGLEYNHLLHDDSLFLNNYTESMNHVNEIKELIRGL